MENQDLKKLLERNTFDILNSIIDPHLGICELQNSIEIIKSDQYSKPLLIGRLLDICAPIFWNDLYYQDLHNNIKSEIENYIKEEKSRFENDPYKDDTLTKLNFEKRIIYKNGQLENIKKVIELRAELRTLMQSEIPDLEPEFARLLQEHNELQANSKKEKEEKDAERENEAEKKRIRIKETQLQKEREQVRYQLQTNLTDEQRGKLCDLLRKNGFISDVTNTEGFKWAFGSTSEHTTFSITWLKSNQSLRELIKAVSKNDFETDKAIAQNIFKTLQRKKITLPKEKQNYTSKEKEDIELINKIIEEVKK